MALFGKLLLAEGLRRHGYPRSLLNNLSHDHYGRPFLDPGIDFNISHSGGFVVCAITDKGKTGVDVEKIRPVPLSDFETVMTAGELSAIKIADKPDEKFFEYWTKKESVIKLDGKGLSIPLTDVVIQNDYAVLNGETIFLREINIATGFKCHLATDMAHPLLELSHSPLCKTINSGGTKFVSQTLFWDR